MKLTHSLVGRVALGGAAASTRAADWFSNNTDVASNIVQARSRWGRAGTYPAMATATATMDPDIRAAMGMVGAAAGAVIVEREGFGLPFRRWSILLCPMP
jgi:hypothetical protein